MGEAKRRALAGDTGPHWKDVKREPPPHDGWPLAVVAIIDCVGHEANGAQIVREATRHDGEWWIDFEHALDITHWMRLPDVPPRRVS